MRFTARDVADATGGILHGPDCQIDGVSFDSRGTTAGQLFVPIVAERDGHDFISAALANGAVAYLDGRGHGSGADSGAGPDRQGTAIEVIDTAQALLDLGRWGRSQLSATVIGITGSVGKTSTKDLTRAALAAGLRTAANERSFNNDQGLPVTILNAADDTEALVLEMGMRGLGEIARLCDVGRPEIGVVTRIAAAHTELLGGIEGVARAKGELVRALPAHGTAVLNGDDPWARNLGEASACRVLTFGTGVGNGVGVGNDVSVDNISLDRLTRARFRVHTPWGSTEVQLGVAGEHMVLNAAAALAVAALCGVDLDAAAHGLGRAGMSPWRMEIGQTRTTGATVINDAYNANPASMRAAVEALHAIRVSGRKIAALGVMAELADPINDHRAIKDLLDAYGIELVAIGTDRYGQEPADDPVKAIGLIAGDDAVLVKGSRVAGLERLAAVLLDQ